MIPLNYYLLISAIVFSISFAGVVINRKNIIMLLMCIELMLLAVNFNFIAFAQYLHAAVGELFVFFILTVAAAESAIGLSILVLIYRRRDTINVDDMNILQG
jgi:NADH-quinone oxidoreductase subunit K